jgi:protein-S-isoprenylcysteine O-methyltransferase Ste14
VTPDDPVILRRTIVLGALLIYCATVFLQARRVRKQIGRSPNVKPRGTKERVLWIGWFLVFVLSIAQPFLLDIRPRPSLLRILPELIVPAGLALGVSLLVAGYACTLWCFAVMGDTWRMGVDRQEKNEMVTRGPYSVVRHPIYVFQIVILTGVLLLLPTLLSITILIMQIACVLTKAIDEEVYLLGVHGDRYRDYRARTGRLVPKLSVRTAFLLAVGFGLACRVSQYAANTSLWHDEAFVALNVTARSFPALFGRLSWNEVAPPGFLVLEKLVVSMLGRSEYALRLVPLLAGLGGTMAFARLARRLATGAACLSTPPRTERAAGTPVWAVLLLAASEKLIVQSNEVKHFTVDLLWAVLLTSAALGILREPRRLRTVALWGLLGALGLWLSFASVFVFTGTSLALAARLLRHEDRRIRAGFLAANFAVALSFALLQGPAQAQLGDQVLGFWSDAFPDVSGPGALFAWLARALLGFFNYFWQPLGVVVALAVSLAGAMLWRSGRRVELALLGLPVALSLAAAFVHRWPFGGNQHMVFAGPAVLLLAGEATEAIRRRLELWRRGAGAVFVVLFLLPGIGAAAFHLAFPRQRHEARPVIRFVEENRRPQDQLLVFCPAEFEFYAGPVFPNPPSAPDPSRRVWFVGTRSKRKPFPNQELLDRLASRRPLLLSSEAYGAASYLFGSEASGKGAQ